MSKHTASAALLRISGAIENVAYILESGEARSGIETASCGDLITPSIRLTASCQQDDLMLNRVVCRPADTD